MALRFIHVGCGGWGGAWCRHFLPPNIADGLIEPVAAVDLNPEALVNAREGLGLPEARCYSDVQRALDEQKPDFVSIVVPPAFHEGVVNAAVARGVHILSEKPIADTLVASCRIAKKVKAAKLKMGVTMSHRFRRDITNLREQVWSGAFGELDYLVSRFTCDNRRRDSWGKFRHEMIDPLMVEGSVHHLDLLADMASLGRGGVCRKIYATTWNAPWGEFAGDSNGLVVMHMEDGRRITYEGAKTNAAGLNCWGNEYIRAECKGATLILDRQAIECRAYQGETKVIEQRDQAKWSNAWLVEQFVSWMNGGKPMATHIDANLQSVALIFAAIESSHRGEPVDVQDFLKKAMDEAG